MSEEPLLYREEKGIARIIFNRPEALNAMSKDLLQDLASRLDNIRADNKIETLHHFGDGCSVTNIFSAVV